MHRIYFIIIFIFAAATAPAASIKYTLSFPEPQTHYVKVTMEIKNWNGPVCRVKLPVWTPGSYMVREFSRFLEQFHAFSQSEELQVSRFRKNGWEIQTKGKSDISIEYYIYAYELTVRTAFIDEEHAYINGAAVFLYIDDMKQLPVVVQINPYPEWKRISVALEKAEKNNQWIYKAGNYDELVDAPFEIGNHDVFSFNAAGVLHEVAMFGNGYYDSLAIKKDFTLIIEQEAKIFGEHPCKYYLFIVHLIPTGSGGLEHMNSTTIQAARNSLSTPSGYNGFLSLAAHEYFHLWNVKRLHPAPLGPFDYDNENYTSLLYFAEGFTAYYDEKVTVRCGMVEPDNYLKTIASEISGVENTPGNKIQSLSESGYDAWIKYYRPNENSTNATVSYYTKGSVMGAMLDLKILIETNGEKGLDDVMKYMYEEFYKKRKTGFTDDELIASVEKVCNCGMKSFFRDYIYNTRTVPYKDLFAGAGIEMTDLNNGQAVPYTGFNMAGSKVSVVERNGPAWKAGLNTGDEILSINNNRITEDPQKQLSQYEVGTQVNFIISRGGRIKTISLTVEQSPKVNYDLKRMENADEKMKKVFEKWLVRK
jgi:predicted metalloprotease with PDZ domain